MQQEPLAHEKAETALRKVFLAMRTDQPVRVPAERVLADRLAISRVTLRRAMSRLVAEGLLSQRQGMGTYVLPAAPPSILEVQLLRSPDVKAEDPFYLTFLTALAAHASARGLRITLLETDSAQADLLPASGKAPSDEPLVVVGTISDMLAARLVQTHSRIISIHGGGRLAQEAEVRFDDRNIGREAFALFFTHGFHRIALLAGPERFDSAADRRRGFLEAAAHHNIAVRVLEEKMNWGGGVRAAEALLANRGSDLFPEAVFAANDWMALGLMQRMREAGVDIPGELSVMGCDNIPLSAEFSPSLATFGLNMPHLVAEMIALLQRAPGEIHGKRILLPATFIRRDSLKASLPADDP